MYLHCSTWRVRRPTFVRGGRHLQRMPITLSENSRSPERSEWGRVWSPDAEILRCPFAALRATAHQDDSPDTPPVRSWEVFSPHGSVVRESGDPFLTSDF